MCSYSNAFIFSLDCVPTGGEEGKTETQNSPVAATIGVNVGATMANATEAWLQVLAT